jgi:hypothetical protein
LRCDLLLPHILLPWCDLSRCDPVKSVLTRAVAMSAPCPWASKITRKQTSFFYKCPTSSISF